MVSSELRMKHAVDQNIQLENRRCRRCSPGTERLGCSLIITFSAIAPLERVARGTTIIPSTSMFFENSISTASRREPRPPCGGVAPCGLGLLRFTESGGGGPVRLRQDARPDDADIFGHG